MHHMDFGYIASLSTLVMYVSNKLQKIYTFLSMKYSFQRPLLNDKKKKKEEEK